MVSETNGIESLNLLSAEEARRVFFSCCGSVRWVEKMLKERPFQSKKSLFEIADQVWFHLDEIDWLEAFGKHPMIGEKFEKGKKWSADEQSGVAGETEKVLRELKEKNEEYVGKFGFVFLVYATGKSGKEMLNILKERLPHERKIELRIAAGEQAKITKLRLEKILFELAPKSP